MDAIHYYDSPLGRIVLASEGAALAGLWFEGQKHFPALDGLPCTDRLVFRETVEWLDCYFGGHEPDFTPELAPSGTVFRKSVWRILSGIPFGSTMTYGQIEAALHPGSSGSGISVRAVAGAVAANPVSIIVPCHRVLGSGGRLTGYAGGLDRKRKLLLIEGALR